MVRGKLPAMSRISLGALIVIDVHARDVVDELARNKVDRESDFQWISQLRYYLEVNFRLRGFLKWGLVIDLSWANRIFRGD